MPNPPAGTNPSARPSTDDELLKLVTSFGVAPAAPQEQVETPYFSSTLEVPTGLAAPQNAKLTITVNYSLWFVDRNTLAGWAVRDNVGNAVMRDGHRTPFRLLDWDSRAWPYFKRQFEKAADFWNNRFRLRTPDEYSGLSYPTLGSAGVPWRPDVDCYLRLTTNAKIPTQLVVYALRPETFDGGDPNYREFRAITSLHRSHRPAAEMFLPMNLKGDSAHDLQVFAHEIGHVIDANGFRRDHIGSRLGTQGCFEDDNAPVCYNEPPGVPPNIMGIGMGLLPVNADGWQTAIEKHTGVSKFKWEAVVR
jgi:hypothetical protein